MSKNISGFPEFLPKEQIAFDKMVEKIKDVFKIHGFTSLDTAAVESVSTLLSKGAGCYGKKSINIKVWYRLSIAYF